MTETTIGRFRYHVGRSCEPHYVERRLKAASEVDDTGAYRISDRQYLELLVVELLAQQVAARRHLFILTTISVASAALGVIAVLLSLALAA